MNNPETPSPQPEVCQLPSNVFIHPRRDAGLIQHRFDEARAAIEGLVKHVPNPAEAAEIKQALGDSYNSLFDLAQKESVTGGDVAAAAFTTMQIIACFLEIQARARLGEQSPNLDEVP